MQCNAPNTKKCLRIIGTISNCGGSFWGIKWLRPFKIRYWPIGFSFHDYFFIRYFQQKDIHYESDIVPIFRQWARLDPALRFDSSLRSELFNKMLINFIDNLVRYDPQSMGRCHLEAFHYSDDRSFETVSNQVLSYNHSIHLFIGHVDETFHVFVRTQLPQIKAYDSSSITNYFHYSNIIYYFWQVFWELQEGKHETTLEVIIEGDTHVLRIVPGQDQLAMAKDKNDVEKLRQYLLDETPAIVSWLTELNAYANDVIHHCRTFTRNIGVILNEHAWNKSIKGKCGWEKGFWRIR